MRYNIHGKNIIEYILRNYLCQELLAVQLEIFKGADWLSEMPAHPTVLIWPPLYCLCMPRRCIVSAVPQLFFLFAFCFLLVPYIFSSSIYRVSHFDFDFEF